MRARYVDVSDLEPPEPMVVAVTESQKLEPDEFLVLAHRREPFPLYTMLETMGFAHCARKGSRTAFEILIWRSSGPLSRRLGRQLVRMITRRAR